MQRITMIETEKNMILDVMIVIQEMDIIPTFMATTVNGDAKYRVNTVVDTIEAETTRVVAISLRNRDTTQSVVESVE